MNKTELTIALAEKTGCTKADVAKVLNGFVEVVEEQLAQGASVQIIGFGTFETSKYEERTGRNPQTGKTITIPAGVRPKFTPGAALKKAVAGK